MKFIPYFDKIEIRPFKKESIIKKPNDTDLIEYGEVIAIGEHVQFVSVGDHIFFDAWGCTKTPEVDGAEHYIVSENKNVILGKYV